MGRGPCPWPERVQFSLQQWRPHNGGERGRSGRRQEPLLPAGKQDPDGEHRNLYEEVLARIRQGRAAARGQEGGTAGGPGARLKSSPPRPVSPRSRLADRTSFLCIRSTRAMC